VASYRVLIKRSAAKELESVPLKDRRRLVARIEGLAANEEVPVAPDRHHIPQVVHTWKMSQQCHVMEVGLGIRIKPNNDSVCIVLLLGRFIVVKISSPTISPLRRTVYWIARLSEQGLRNQPYSDE